MTFVLFADMTIFMEHGEHLYTHVPECYTPWMSECICDALRMCEERVRKENHCLISYNNALDKAKNAIAFDINVSRAFEDREYIQRAEVLAIIDSLKENDENSNNGV